MNYVDWTYFLLIAAAIAIGFIKGFIFTIIDLACIAGSIVMGIVLQQSLSVYINSIFNLSEELILFISFLLPIVIFFTLFSMLLFRLKQLIPERTIKHPANKIAGVLVAIALVFSPIYFFSSSLNNLPLSDAALNEVKSSNAFSTMASLKPKNAAKKKKQEKITVTYSKDTSTVYRLPFKTAILTERADLETLMLTILNKERNLHNLPSLSVDPELRVVALAHSKDMMTRGYFSHNTPEGIDPFMRMRSANIQYTIAGENLAVSQDLYKAHTLLMLSPGHRANILSPSYSRVGIGIVDAGKHGLMISQEFRN